MTEPAPTISRGRRIAIWTLIVLATLLSVLSILTLWLNRQLLDNNNFKSASKQLIQDPQVQSALSVYLVNQLYTNVDVAAALRQRLPNNLDPLATPLATALRQPAADAVRFMLQRPRIQNVWILSSGIAHDKLVNVLENKTGHGIATGSGVVTLDLGQLVTELGTEIGLPKGVLAKIPSDTGQITIMRSKQLSTAQKAVKLIRFLSVWLLILVLVMYAVAVYLARGERRTTLRTIAWAFVGVGLLVLVIRKLAGNYVVGALTAPAYHTPVHHVWLIETSSLGQIGRATILYGLVTLVGVLLAGPTRAGVAARRTIAPVLNEHQGVTWSVFALVYLLIVLWGGTHALRTWWGVLLIGGLLAFGLVALRRQTLAEAPQPTPAAPPEAPAEPPGVEEPARLP